MPDTNKYCIKVEPSPQFLAEQSDPENHRYLFAYTITIVNVGDVAAQLVSRHWIITDANNEVQEVRGLGVVGKQPLLQPGESFQYTSGCPLTTPSGMMVGSYHMLGSDGHAFAIDIPAFSLDSPHERPTFN